MIYKKDSSEIMEEFDNAKAKLNEAQDKIETATDAIQRRLKILNYSQTYLMNGLMKMRHKMDSGALTDKIILSNTEKKGLYSEYGMTVHPHLIKTPTNIFNFMSGTGPIFKNGMTVKVNNTEDDDFKYMLMHDNISTKDFIIKEYDSSELVLDIDLGNSNGIGDMRFNMLELHPFLAGSFDISVIEIYEQEKEEPAHRLTNIYDVPACRLLLDEKVALKRIVFTFNLKYREPSNNHYIFGMKHLYLYNADFNDNSYVIVAIKKNKAIEYIYNDVIVHSQYGQNLKTTTQDIGAEFYLDYSDGVLSRQIEVSTDSAPSYISSNNDTVYMKMPVDSCLTAITPDIRTMSN